MRRLAVLATLVLVLVLLGVAQLVLPGLAAQRLRDRLADSGQVESVKVSAFPAIELLWHHADRVVIRMRRYRSSSGQIGDMLQQAGDAGSLDASVGELESGLLTLRDATLRKRGDTLAGAARVTETDLRSAVPFLDAVRPVASADGSLTLRGTATVLGVTATADATVTAANGRLVVVPQLPFGGLATITLFNDSAVDVRAVGASDAPGGFSVFAQGNLR